jgi:hypothetical protein
VIVDDGSKDGSRYILKKLDGKGGVRVILDEKNQDKGAANMPVPRPSQKRDRMTVALYQLIHCKFGRDCRFAQSSHIPINWLGVGA